MFGWLRRLTRKPDPAGRLAAPPHTTSPPSSVDADASDPLPVCSPLSWLLQAPAPRAVALSPEERRILQAVDTFLARESLSPQLLPRAPAVIPPLLHALRQPEPSRKAVVERLSKDLVLATEVLRLARSAYHLTSSQIASLDDAVTVVGDSGVKAAIARVLLRPMFDPRTSGLAAIAAPRGWSFAERQADRCAQMAADAGLDRLDGFLGGMLHATGRTALLRVLDLCDAAPPWPCSLAFDQTLGQQSTRLAGRFMAEWDVTPGLTLAASVLVDTPDLIDPTTLAGILLESERQTTRDMMGTPIPGSRR